MPLQARAVLHAEPDAYDVRKPWLMGRQVAGHGFLRAYLASRDPGPVHCFTPTRAAAGAFASIVEEIDSTAEVRWLRPSAAQQISDAGGVLNLGDPTLSLFAPARLRFGMGSYSICGITHTTASAGAMRAIADILSTPAAPWDALICTSRAVASTVQRLHEAEADYLRWRFRSDIRISFPQLPVIPLGVHCADFEFDDAERHAARSELTLEADEVAALFVGRLTFAGKHHPFALYRAAEEVTRRTGKRLVLILCGWSPNDTIAAAFSDGAAKFAPAVRTMIIEGRDRVRRRQAWAAGDVFVSISDGIQETFGLTPLEAMAAGLPCVVSDWNGYKDTVRDGVDGFRIRTWAPENGAAGEGIAREFEARELTYDRYLWAAAAATSVDAEQLVRALSSLVQNSDLRKTMGKAARERAKNVFDWSAVMRQYHELWGELTARREAARDDQGMKALLAGAPRASPATLSPFDAFGHYPSDRISAATRLTLTSEGTIEAFLERRADILFSGVRVPDRIAAAMIAHLQAGPSSVHAAGRSAGIARGAAIYAAGVLAKMGIVRLGNE